MTARKVDAYDIIIGINIRYVRQNRGYTLEDMTHVLDVTMQQYAKYEIGRNRISASSLYKVARYFNVDIRTFFNIDR